MQRSGGPRRPLLGAAMLGFAVWQAAFINTPPGGSSRGRPWLASAPRAAKTVATVAAAGTGNENFLWVQLKDGGPIKLPNEGIPDVFTLLEAVYAKVEARLKPRGVTVDQLKLYSSKETFENSEEALRPGLRLDQLEGGTDDLNPLYVTYGAGVSEASLSEVAPTSTQPAEHFDFAKEEGRKRLVESLDEKWGLRTDRLETCARLDAGRLAFAQTQEREGAFADLLQVWKGNFEADTPRNKLPLPAVPAAPGTGKTRFAWLAATRGRLPGSATVDEEWRRATDKLEAGDFRTGIENAIGVAVTFNCDADPVEGEEHRFMIGVRMLYGHFCDVNAVAFDDFLEFLRNHGCQRITTRTAMRIIEQDIEAKHALDGGAKRHVILVVDEPLRSVNADTPKERREQLGALTTSVGQLITNYPHMHVLMTSLSGSDLEKAAWTASGRSVHFLKDFFMLSWTAVGRLVAAESEPRKARLQQPKFQAVLGECMGVPRLLEKVFLAANLTRIKDDSACEAIRKEVERLFESHNKYRSRELRNHALLAALSGPWRPASDGRNQHTRAAEREGYLFDGRIPPLLLNWWWNLPDEHETSDEMHALLKAAVDIYTCSDKVGGARHGPQFEKQLAHLWRILTITDAVSRREAGEGQRRTIHGMLGRGQLAGAGDAVSTGSLDDAAATFNLGLGELNTELLLKPFRYLDKPATGPTDVPTDFVPGILYFPKDDQNPGFDFMVVERAAASGAGVLVLVEAKFSVEVAKTGPLSSATIVDKYVNAIRDRPTVCHHLLAGRLCYVVGGLRGVQTKVMQNVDAVVSAIVDKLLDEEIVQCRRREYLVQLVRGSLMLLTRRHTEALLTPTLSSLPPFAEPR